MRGSLKPVKNRNGELIWRGQWRENGAGRTRILGTVREMGRAEARTLLDAIVKPLATQRRSTAVTLSAYVRDEYLVSRSAVWKRSTEYTTTHLLEQYVIGRIGDKPLAAVTRKDVEGLLRDLAAANTSWSIVERVRWQLKAIFELAMGDGKVSANPISGVKTPRGTKPPEAPTVADESLVSKAMMLMTGTAEKLFFALTAKAGLRPGEVAAIQIGDIVDNTLYIKRRIYRGVIDVPKSKKGLRDVFVGEWAALIAEHVSHLSDTGPSAWLFPSEKRDTPLDYPNFYRRRLKPILDKAGLFGTATMTNFMGRAVVEFQQQAPRTNNARLSYVWSGVRSTAPRRPRGFHGVVPSYGWHNGKLLKLWSGRWDSNPRRSAWELARHLEIKNFCVHGVNPDHRNTLSFHVVPENAPKRSNRSTRFLSFRTCP